MHRCVPAAAKSAARAASPTGSDQAESDRIESNRPEPDRTESDLSVIPRVVRWNSSIDLLRVTRRVVAHWIRTVRTGVARRRAIFLVSERAAVVRVDTLLHVANTVLRPVVRSVNDRAGLLIEVAMRIALDDVLDHRNAIVIAA